MPMVTSEPFVVEVWGKPVGVVVKHGDDFRFHAIAPSVFGLDCMTFAKPGYARVAAARLHASHRKQCDQMKSEGTVETARFH